MNEDSNRRQSGDNNWETKEVDLNKLYDGKLETEEQTRDLGFYNFVYNSAIASRLHAQNEI